MHSSPFFDLKFDLIEPAYKEIRRLLPDLPVRLDADAAEAALGSECPVRKMSMPWIWATAKESRVGFRVNATRIGAKLAAEGVPEILSRLGPYTQLLTTVLESELMKAITDEKGSLALIIQDLPISDLPEARIEDAARLRQAAELVGVTVAQLHNTILMRTLH